MKQAIIILSLVLILVGALLIFSIKTLTGQAVANRYSYTKAVCNENSCQDYEIECEGNKVVNMKAVGKVVQLPENWQDLRDEEMREKLC